MKVPRVVTAILLLLVLFSLCLYSHLEYERHLPYPNGVDVISNQKGQVGMVFIFGTVTSSSEDTSVVSSGGYNFTVKPMTARVGDKAEVLGMLESDYRISAEKTVVYNPTSYYLIFVRSLVGAALLAFVFLKGWKFEARRFKFVER